MQKVQLSNLPLLAKNVLAKLTAKKNAAAIIALSGELGAGKTTFVQTLGKELGIAETIQSPTYVLMKSYPISNKKFNKLIHIDAYRLNNAQEFVALKPGQFLNDPKVLVVVEWPERVEGALPEPDIAIGFSSEDAGEGERFVEIKNN